MHAASLRSEPVSCGLLMDDILETIAFGSWNLSELGSHDRVRHSCYQDLQDAQFTVSKLNILLLGIYCTGVFTVTED